MMRIAILAGLIGIGFSANAVSQEFKTNEYKVTAKVLEEAFGESLGAAKDNAARPLAPIGLDLIKHFEGFEPDPYNDPSGYCTIGYGHLLELDRCENIELGEFASGVSDETASSILLSDTAIARAIVQKSVTVEIDDEQFAALTSFVFNIGGGNFRNSTMLKLLNEGAYSAAAKQFPRWVKSKGQILPGLVARRACEEALFLGDLQFNEGEAFDRAACQSLGVADAPGSLIDIETGE